MAPKQIRRGTSSAWSRPMQALLRYCPNIAVPGNPKGTMLPLSRAGDVARRASARCAGHRNRGGELFLPSPNSRGAWGCPRQKGINRHGSARKGPGGGPPMPGRQSGKGFKGGCDDDEESLHEPVAERCECLARCGARPLDGANAAPADGDGERVHQTGDPFLDRRLGARATPRFPGPPFRPFMTRPCRGAGKRSAAARGVTKRYISGLFASGFGDDASIRAARS